MRLQNFLHDSDKWQQLARRRVVATTKVPLTIMQTTHLRWLVQCFDIKVVPGEIQGGLTPQVY